MEDINQIRNRIKKGINGAADKITRKKKDLKEIVGLIKERQIISEDKTTAYNIMVNRNHSKRTRISE